MSSSSGKPAYRRVLLKLSGEALMGEDAFGINRATVEAMVADIGEVVKLGVEVAIVIGDGVWFLSGKEAAGKRGVRYILDPWPENLNQIPGRSIRYNAVLRLGRNPRHVFHEAVRR